MTIPFIVPPEQALAEGFAERLVRWARDDGASGPALDLLRAAARATSLATASGHVCTDLAEVAGSVEYLDDPALRAALLACAMVGTPQVPDTRPLILDAQGRLYLHRYFDYERRLARRLASATSNGYFAVGDATKALLDQRFAANAARLAGRPDWQKIATALALLRPLTIVSGGPGTGKTTTVVNVLACALTEDPCCRIRLAAPTGKAAARMQDAIRKAAADLPAALRERLPADAFTVHRLLGAAPGSGAFAHHADNPLPVDLLVVDEASMLDLALATRLVEALPPAARIILLGDKDQLAAVESGAVFAELSVDPALGAACVKALAALTGIDAGRIVPPAPARATGLVDAVVWLTENFRFAADSGIGRLAARVNAGEAEAALALLAADEPALDWLDDARASPEPETLARLLDGLAGYVDAARAGLADKPALFAALARFRVLCAEREGPRGVDAINRYAARAFRRALDHPLDPGERSEWFPGRPVMVLRNDYVLKLYNGDVGMVLPGADDELYVYFPEPGGGFRAVAPLRLPEHETAFATTVHKAQGSEFDRVMLLLPARPTRVVTRELVYTAITRARSGVTIVGGGEVIAKAIATPTRRYSGLLARIAEARGDGDLRLAP